MFKTFLTLSSSSIQQVPLSLLKKNPSINYKLLQQFATKKGKQTNPYGGKTTSKGQQTSKHANLSRITEEPNSPYQIKTILGTKDSKGPKGQTKPTIASSKVPFDKSMLKTPTGQSISPASQSVQSEPIDEELEKFRKSGKVTILATEESDEAVNFKLDLPWDFKGIMTKQPEGNLKFPTGMGKLLNYSIAIGIFKDYVQALEEFDTERLEELLETSFCERLVRTLNKMKKKGYELKVEGLSSKKNKVDLFNVTNIFCVGAFTNRKLNDGANSYFIFNNHIEGSPTKNYIKSKKTGTEKAVVKVVLDLMLETPVKIQLIDKNGDLMGNKREKEIEFHHMKIENDVYEVDYCHLRESVNSAGEVEGEGLDKFEFTFSHDNWKIIDFDNYMNGNEIVQEKVIL